MTNSVLIVGASVAGVGAANELRRCGFAGEIILSDSQSHLPYDRPPLSKAALGDESTDTCFHEASYYQEKGIQLRLGATAEALDTEKMTVTFSDGKVISAEKIVIATGSRARRLPDSIATCPVHVIRDLDDAKALRPLLKAGSRLAMIGGGFIGAEVAATASKLGLRVTIFDIDEVPLARVLGAPVAARVCSMHDAAGVRLVCGAPVSRIESSLSRSTVILKDGTRYEADIIVAGLGAVPNVEWLKTSPIQLADGVLCNEVGQTSHPNIYAAGDVAAWKNTLTGRAHRHEHWTAAREQARIVAQQIACAPEARWDKFVPYFWSDIHGKRIQLLGTSTGATDISFVFENPETGAFVAEYHQGERLIGVAGCNAAARVMRYAPQLAT